MPDEPGRPTVYIETTIVSYLTARPSGVLRRAADQLTTRQWWDSQRGRFELVTSQLTVSEATAGDPEAARRRLDLLDPIPTADAVEGTAELAQALLAAAAVPASAKRDALHVAIAAINGIDYLLTWNCKHLANAALRDKIARTCAEAGVRAPVITTPHELFEERPDEDEPAG